MRFILALVLVGCSVDHNGLQARPVVDGGVDVIGDVRGDVERIDGCVESAETCNRVDDDCDGRVDEETSRACGTDIGDCTAGLERCVDGDYTGTCEGETPPGVELCDRPGDEDCDGSVNEMCECSGPVECGPGTTEGICEQGTQACTDGMLQPCVGAVNRATEVCNGLDDNCDGTVDEGVTVSAFVDGDGDGYGTGPAMMICAGTAGYATRDGDCIDGNSAINPGQPDPCDGVDSDCSGPETVVTYYRDADGDGHGSLAMPMTSCSGAPVGFVASSDDCDDSADTGPRRYPMAVEVCDGLDNDCDGDLDENDCAGCVRRVRADGHVYQFCSDAVNWAAARSACQAIGYDLVTIESEGEHDFLKGGASPDGSSWWIGLNDITTEGTYVWASTGSAATYTDPLNAGTASQDCLVLRDDITSRRWSDRACTDANFYTCEVAP